MSTAFLLTSLAVVISPGTGVLYTLGIVPHMAAAIVGLAALLYASSVAFQAPKLVGVAYLLYLAWHVLARPRVLTRLRRSFAAAFVGLGARLALAER